MDRDLLANATRYVERLDGIFLMAKNHAILVNSDPTGADLEDFNRLLALASAANTPEERAYVAFVGALAKGKHKSFLASLFKMGHMGLCFLIDAGTVSAAIGADRGRVRIRQEASGQFVAALSGPKRGVPSSGPNGGRGGRPRPRDSSPGGAGRPTAIPSEDIRQLVQRVGRDRSQPDNNSWLDVARAPPPIERTPLPDDPKEGAKTSPSSSPSLDPPKGEAGAPGAPRKEGAKSPPGGKKTPALSGSSAASGSSPPSGKASPFAGRCWADEASDSDDDDGLGGVKQTRD